LQVLLPLLIGFTFFALQSGGLSPNVVVLTAYLALFLGFVPASARWKAVYLLAFPLLPLGAYSVLAWAAQLTFNFGYSAAFQSGQITAFGLLTIYGEFLVISICALAAWLGVGAMLKTGPAQPPL
jgi:hypothetical protein